ncbi:16S rRNA (cytidine(1402)-2'-O)-methyltransferase [bacterium]|nr:16S rRNA (cytidine(1402)-2'-O)-methyltransferase [bacterium]
MPIGKLIIVPTPIGNLEDITLRAIRLLREVDIIAAEDTRSAKFLLEKHGIFKKTFPYHVKNERRLADRILELVENGKTVAVISESGTPGISDPGWTLIRKAVENEIPFEVLPGPCAFIPALLLSGFPVTGFSFEGFLPHSGKGRRRRLRILAKDSPHTHVFYESPHRINAFLKDAFNILGDRPVAICRELTKIYEETIRGMLSDLVNNCPEIRGEVVVLIAPYNLIEDKEEECL